MLASLHGASTELISVVLLCYVVVLLLILGTFDVCALGGLGCCDIQSVQCFCVGGAGNDYQDEGREI